MGFILNWDEIFDIFLKFCEEIWSVFKNKFVKKY